MKQSDPRDIRKQITICEVKLYGSETTEEGEFFTDCEISASELSECVVIKVKGTHSAIKIKKTALLSLIGYPCNHNKYIERI
ncbi:hypothetical protein [Acetobacterium wieringae]|uniref:Uncharacterized protein n=1 Tax=Acetobacterium wieringae TaxID=52694 RepID=A0A1F2PE46_9FIRM|nr:hypothetical protein [Acetobacterium wieringae]OFV69274.1 hypothetical protein ACWI_33180 [Acetobacterium wieringae]